MASVLILIESDDSPGLGLSSSEAGALGSVFIIGFMLAAPICAHLAQFLHPIWLIISGMFVWSGATLLCGFSTNFWMVLTGRALTGIGEASCLMNATPYILDHAPEGKKTLWVAVFYIAGPGGVAAGFVLGYAISEATGSWHWPFRIECAVMICILLLG